MRRMMRTVGFVAFVSASPTLAQTVPDDLNKFGLVCFCSSRVATPHLPISLDDNGKLLFAARRGVTREGLRSANIAFNDSQLRMLKDWSLLTEKEKVLTTAFPVLEPLAMSALRQRLQPVAAKLLPSLQPHVGALKQEMARRRQPEATYAVLFSYVLDGLVWKELESSGRLPNTDVTVDKPFWAGTFWAVYPKQNQMPGTNGRSQGHGELRMLWTPKVVEQINAFYGSTEAGNWLRALDRGAPLPALYSDSSVRPVVIREEAGDLVFAHGSAIAKTVAAAMLDVDLSRELRQSDASQRLLIGTHELIWILLDAIASEQRITLPAVLSRGARTNNDLAPLIIGVFSARKG